MQKFEHRDIYDVREKEARHGEVNQDDSCSIQSAKFKNLMLMETCTWYKMMEKSLLLKVI